MLGSAMPRSLLKMPGPSWARYYEHKTTTSARKARRSVKRARVLLRRACKHQTFSGDCRCAAVCRRAWATGAAYRGRRAELRRLICVHELHVDATCSCEQARHAQTVSAAGSAGLSRRGAGCGCRCRDKAVERGGSGRCMALLAVQRSKLRFTVWRLPEAAVQIQCRSARVQSWSTRRALSGELIAVAGASD